MHYRSRRPTYSNHLQEFGSSLDEQKSGSDILWPVWFIRHGKLCAAVRKSKFNVT